MGDKIGVQRVALQQHRIYEESGVSSLPMLLMPLVQLPVTLGMFFGVKKLCTPPLEQLPWSGVSFLPDLTVTDPFYVLLVVATVLKNVQLEVRKLLANLRLPEIHHMSAQATWLQPRTAQLQHT